MGQWQSQTRKMNRHYQSVSKGDEGLIYNDWPNINTTIYLYPSDGNGSSYFSMLTTPDDPTLNKFEVLIGYNYFVDYNFIWEERAEMTFNFAAEKVKTVNRITKTIDGIEYNATQVIIPSTMITNKSDELFNATTQEPDEKPFFSSITDVVITLTDVVDYQRKLIVEYRGTVKDYAYVGEFINKEAIETIYV